MGFIHENYMFIIIVLLLLLIATITVAVILKIQHNKHLQDQGNKRSSHRPNQRIDGNINKRNNDDSDYGSKKDYKKLKHDYDDLNKEHHKLQSNYSQIKDRYGESALKILELQDKINDLKTRISELTRDNDELDKLRGKDHTQTTEEKTSIPVSSTNVPKENSKEETSNVDVKKVEQPNKEEAIDAAVEQERAIPNEKAMVVENPKEETLYASFPRSAGNRIYFSDLTEIRCEDSYFELRISKVTGKAVFKPLDFMKIRNYDPAMIAMLTEGAKPNVASSVIGVESGTAHIEGMDWIIDNLAKIKLA